MWEDSNTQCGFCQRPGPKRLALEGQHLAGQELLAQISVWGLSERRESLHNRSMSAGLLGLGGYQP